MRQSPCRHAANALLPWVARGTLQSEEMDWVGDHIATCAVCTRELDNLASEARAGGMGGGPAGDPRGAPGGTRRWAPWMAWSLAAALIVPALVGIEWLWLGLPGTGGSVDSGISPAVYLDLAGGPARRVEPLRSIPHRPGVESVVIAFLPPLSEGVRYRFDLEGPRGHVLVRDHPIERIDRQGRCAFSFPPAMFETSGDYAVVVRSVEPSGEVRLYPYPFQVSSAGS